MCKPPDHQRRQAANTTPSMGRDGSSLPSMTAQATPSVHEDNNRDARRPCHGALGHSPSTEVGRGVSGTQHRPFHDAPPRGLLECAVRRVRCAVFAVRCPVYALCAVRCTLCAARCARCAVRSVRSAHRAGGGGVTAHAIRTPPGTSPTPGEAPPPAPPWGSCPGAPRSPPRPRARAGSPPRTRTPATRASASARGIPPPPPRRVRPAARAASAKPPTEPRHADAKGPGRRTPP